MTANDHGHVNNLDKKQLETLKGYWIALANDISSQSSLAVDQIVDSVYGNELFYAFGCNNPDVFALRYLRARKWNIHTAVQHTIDTLNWRHKWGIQALLERGESGLSEEEIKTGKSYLICHDKAGRPINVVSAKDHIKGQFPNELTEKLTVLIMETGRKLAEPHIETGTVIFDMAGFGMKNMDYQHVKFALSLIQNYYPESFGMGLILNAPWLFYGCWTIIKQWMDPALESKIHFIKNEADLAKYIDPSILPRRLNGSQPDFEYIPPTDHEKAMVATFCADTQGKADCQAAHKEAARCYLNVTLQWAHSNESPNFIEERKTAAKQLSDAFEKLLPYISTPTHYHRAGFIKEPIFHTTYDRLCESTLNNN